VAAATYSTNGLSLAIPDGNAAGVSSIITVPDFYDIASITLTLDISGAFNGDLYAYVRHDSGFAVLLNRVGRSGSLAGGYADTGFSITFDDAAASDVHTYRAGAFTLNGNGQLTGTWQPDGRGADPELSLDISPRSEFLSDFNNAPVNGQWTLFLADVSGGGGQSTLNSWSVTVNPVPEPSTVVMFVLGGLGIFFLARGSGGRRSS